MRKKGYVMFLTATMILTLGMFTAQADAAKIPEEEKQLEEIMPMYEEISDIQTDFYISGNTANMQLTVLCPSTKKVSIKMILQRKDGNSWAKVQTWNKTGTGNQTLSKSIIVTDGKKYRMKYKVTVGSETVTDKTAAKTA